jgi:HEAT repeat protein
MIALLGDEEEDVRSTAAESLGKFSDRCKNTPSGDEAWLT